MEKFEYKSVTICFEKDFSKEENIELDNKLNELGKDGWELVTVIEGGRISGKPNYF